MVYDSLRTTSKNDVHTKKKKKKETKNYQIQITIYVDTYLKNIQRPFNLKNSYTSLEIDLTKNGFSDKTTSDD